MLSSHHGKTVTSVPSSTSCENTQPYYSVDCNDIRISNTESYASKMAKGELMNSMDINSPKKYMARGINGVEGQSLSVKPESLTFAERLQRKDLVISTDIQLSINNNTDQNIQVNTPRSPAIHSTSHSQLQQQQQQRHARTSGTEGTQYDAPPANCKVPMNLSRRSSLALMSPPLSAGLVKSATTHVFFPGNDQLLSDTSRSNSAIPSQSDLDSPKPRALQKRRSSITSVNRRHSVSNNVHNLSTSTNTNPLNIAVQRLVMGNNLMGALGAGMGGSYLPTPTEPTFRSSTSGEPNFYMDYASQIPPTMSSFQPPTPSEANFPSGVHPFDIALTVGTADTWASGKLTGVPSMPLPMSTATKSATIQYLQQLQQTMMQQQPDPQGIAQSVLHQQNAQILQAQQNDGLSALAKQQKALQPGQGSQSRRGSKAKVKRRVGSVSGPSTQSYMSAELPWSTLSDHTQLMAVQSVLPSHQCSSTDALSLASKQPSLSRPYYHGPAPCGNPEPLYEYLASPTVVPGLEIIGHDYYGYYVQILPICPETTCSMNQDPVYLNLLQAIYAHTIPFLDLAPGSEEETQRLMNGTPSAIATQSIQPPFKHLIPVSNNAGQGTNGARNMSVSHSTMTASVSLPTFQQSSNNNKLNRKASVPSIGSPAAPSSRRSSTVSNPSLSNPARKKKNAPRTHPYKSTSAYKEDNPMVTEAILTQVGGLGGIGNSATVSVTDPRHKVAEKMVHMDEAEYAAHYSKHQQSISKSSSSSSLCLAQTLTTSMSGSSLGPLDPSSLMASSVSAPSITNATVSSIPASSTSPLESIAAADFIRALSECNGGMSDLGLNPNEPASVSSELDFSDSDLVSLENLMMMDGAAAAAVQAAASTAWPNWFDLNQLEKDVCQEGMTHQASAFSSASCSMNDLPLSSSTTLASFANISRDNTSTNLLLSSSTDLAMMDDILDDDQHQNSGLSPQSSQDSEMTLAAPVSKAYHQNSTSQILVFDQFSVSPTETGSSDHSASSSSTSIASLSATGAKPFELKRSVSNDLSIPYSSSLLTVLPFSAEHSHPIFPTRGSRRSGWYRSKSVASQGLTQITGVDYTTTCWYDVEQLQNVVRDSISFQESSVLKSLEDLTEPNPPTENA
ncbi:hypothetical protein BGX26_003211 [Mortierella sp. AD094]|nr:hypothetical protein BGX26_003211 [Mortierella sp. AD094]